MSLPQRLRRLLSAPATLVLALACSAVWLAAALLDGLQFGPATSWAFASADDLWGGRYLPLFTSSLVHLEPLHLVFNLYWLVALGVTLEHELGAKRLMGLTLAASFVASAAQLAIDAQTGIGFSGVIYAWAGFMWFARPRYPSFENVMTLRSGTWFLVWLVACFFIPFVGQEVGNAAHVGGLVFGAALGLSCLPRTRTLGLGSTALVVTVAAASLGWAPWNPSWHIYKGYLALNQGKVESAEAHALAARHGEELGRALWLSAEVARHRGDLKRAVPLFVQALEHLPSFADGPGLVARDAMAAGDCKRAEPLYLRALELQPNHPATLIGMGRCQECLGNHDQALVHYTAALAQSPAHPEASALRGWLNLTLGHASEALVDLEVAASNATQRDSALQGTVRAQLRLGRLGRALAASGTRLSVPSKEKVHPGLPEHGLVLLHLNKLDEALLASTEAVTQGTPDDFTQALHALILLASDRRQDAVERLRLSARNPSHFYSALWLAVLADESSALRDAEARDWELELQRFALGQIDTEALLERALVGPAEGREGRRCEALTFAAVMAERSGRPERAVELYARALETGRNEYLESAYARLRLRALGQTP